MAMQKKDTKRMAIIIASYLFIGGITGFMGYTIGEDMGINKITVVRDYKTKGVIGSVNGRSISEKELKHRMDIFSELNKGTAISEEEINKLESDFIEYVLTTEALYDEAKKGNITVTEEELKSHYDSTMGQVCQMLGIDMDTFLRKFKISDEYIRGSIEKEALASKYLSEKIVITDDAVKDEYDKDPSAFNEVRASHILIRDMHDEQNHEHKEDDAIKKQAEDVLKKAQDGEDFAELAKKHSTDGSAADGGDLDFFGKGQMVKEFEDAVFTLKKNEIFPSVVKTDFGYHVIKKTDDKAQTFDTVKEDLKNKLMMDGQDKLMQDILDKSKIEIKMGNNKDKKINVIKK